MHTVIVLWTVAKEGGKVSFPHHGLICSPVKKWLLHVNRCKLLQRAPLKNNQCQRFDITARFCWASFFLSWLSHYTTHFPFPTPEFLRSFHYTNNATRSLSIYNSPHICLCSDFKGFQADVSYYPSGTFFQGKKKTVFVLHCANQLLELFCTGVFYLENTGVCLWP